MRRMAAAVLAMLLACSIAIGEGLRYQDGVYRGFYYSDGMEQVAVQFELKDGCFKSVVLRNLRNNSGSFMDEEAEGWKKLTRDQFEALCDYLIGKPVAAIDALYMPQEILAQKGYEMSPRIQYGKLISALWDGVNHRPFKLVDTSKLPEADPYPDGLYTGVYSDDDGEQVVLEFTVKDNVIEEICYRKLEYKGVDYMSADASDAVRKMAGQFQALIDYLVGKDISAVNDLYQPGNIAADTDVSSAATLRAPKIISAIWEGVNKNEYIVK